MLPDSRIQNTWLEMLREASEPEGIQVQKLGEGYFAVVLASPAISASKVQTVPDNPVLQAEIPNLKSTRAVFLNSQQDYALSEIEPLPAWAGDLARDVEGGTRQAFAVVDPEVFAERVEKELEAAGWAIEREGWNVKASDGRFIEQVNLLRFIVQMVFSRSGMAGAVRAVREEIARRFALDVELFQRFESRFRDFAPAILDHYFIAYPEVGCLAAGWDDWQLSGKTSAEAECIFQRAMQDFETFLCTPTEHWLPGFPTSVCHTSNGEN